MLELKTSTEELCLMSLKIRVKFKENQLVLSKTT